VQAESNADDRRKISIKTRAAMRAKAERGEPLGPAPFGYRHEGKNRIIYEPEAQVVRDIFARYAGGQGFKKIADATRTLGAMARPRAGRLRDRRRSRHAARPTRSWR